MPDLDAIQSALREAGLAGWLLYDFRGSNPLARRVLGLDGPIGSRRWAYFVPDRGMPRKLVHRIEPRQLEPLPGEPFVYLSWQAFQAGIHALVGSADRIAMEYSPDGAIPYVSRVDAGLIDLVRQTGVTIVSSGDLIQRFEATLTDEQIALHREAEAVTTGAYAVAWGLIRQTLRDGRSIRETDVAAAIVDHFTRHGCVRDYGPIVAVNGHAADPHYEPVPGADAEIRRGDLVLVDLWCRRDVPAGIYSDLTRMGFAGDVVPDVHARTYQTVLDARDAAIALVRERFAAGRPLAGYEVDRAARTVIEQAGHGPDFVHRTGHSIGRETHGSGTHMDDLETHDTRLVIPRTCFSIEPGIYLPGEDRGYRSEIDILIDGDGVVHVCGGPQTAIEPILSDGP